ncbi:hypothetical protein [Streptomyces sp. CB01580]|uniref:hypothetical protein n=1 Tax=Streptomyces sp. CB01580 TaxID=1703933 RepID=UPI001300E5BE|nr:hypothetical protein [Streptomyces sp. CB01580]
MTTTRKTDDRYKRPQFELRCGGLHITLQRVPAWLVGLITTASGAAATWWTTR